MAVTFAPEIRELLNEVLAEEGQLYSEQFLLNLKQEITSYLLAEERMEKRFNEFAKNNSIVIMNELTKTKKDVTTEYLNYRIAKKFIQQNAEIDTMLKKGYEIIDLLRATFTGEEIVYSVGVNYRNKLYEGNLSLAEILAMAKVEPNWKNKNNENIFKLRLSGSSKAELKNKFPQPNNDKRSTLFSSIRKYASPDKKWNRGNVYEAYKKMAYEYGSNRIPPAKWDPNKFDEIFSEVKKNTTSFVKGGDFFNESIKFFDKSAPSLANLSTIKKALEVFNDIISQANTNNIKTGLQVLFNREVILDEVDLDLENLAEEEIEKLYDLLKTASKM